MAGGPANFVGQGYSPRGEKGRFVVPADLRADVFAAGDHFNDIPMLDGLHASHACCPSNAIPEVREIVLRSNGHIASKRAADGVAEAWHFFENAP